MLAGNAIGMVTKPPRLVTNPLAAASLRCDRTIASIAGSTSWCSARAKSATRCADLNGPLPSIPTSIRRSIMGVTAPSIGLSSSLAHCAVSPAGPSSLPRISMSVLLLAIGLACQHWIMLLANVARTSNQVSGTRSRLSKVSLISDLLQQCARQVAGGLAPADEVGLATRYLSGSLRHRRTGIELSSLAELLSELPKAPDTGVMTLSELDTVLQQAGELAGAGSSRVRANLFLGLVRKLTAQERVLVQGLLRGGLRQGALESVVMTAVADAGGVAVEDVRRAVAARGDLPGVAQALLVDGPGVLELFCLTVGRGVSPMLASSARSVAEALAKSGPAGVEWKLLSLIHI